MLMCAGQAAPLRHAVAGVAGVVGLNEVPTRSVPITHNLSSTHKLSCSRAVTALTGH